METEVSSYFFPRIFLFFLEFGDESQNCESGPTRGSDCLPYRVRIKWQIFIFGVTVPLKWPQRV